MSRFDNIFFSFIFIKFFWFIDYFLKLFDFFFIFNFEASFFIIPVSFLSNVFKILHLLVLIE